jgi:hypothetical protein
MANMSLVEQLQKIEREIQGAEVEVGIREKQLSELRPKRLEIESECKAKFGCPISKLADVIKAKEEEIATSLSALAAELETAKSA